MVRPDVVSFSFIFSPLFSSILLMCVQCFIGSEGCGLTRKTSMHGSPTRSARSGDRWSPIPRGLFRGFQSGRAFHFDRTTCLSKSEGAKEGREEEPEGAETGRKEEILLNLFVQNT